MRQEIADWTANDEIRDKTKGEVGWEGRSGLRYGIARWAEKFIERNHSDRYLAGQSSLPKIMSGWDQCWSGAIMGNESGLNKKFFWL
jgi:hypothetical protein